MKRDCTAMMCKSNIYVRLGSYAYAKQKEIALYTHCASHRLNLCVVKCCKIQEANSMMQTADNVCRFFSNSPK